MAHEIDTMMFVGEVPWHKLGRYVGDMEVTADEAIVAAGLDWEVEGIAPQVPALDGSGMLDIEGYQAIRRKDNGAVLSIMSDGYKFVQNRGKFNFFDAVVGSGEAKYHTAMSLDEGRKIALLAKLPKTMKIKNDGPVEEYVLLADSFDGSTAFTMMLTPVRVVCANTLNAALMSGQKVAYKLRHSVNIENRIAEAQHALGFAVKEFDKFEAAANHLVDTTFTDKQMMKLGEKLFPAKNEDGVLTVSPQSRAAREAVLDLFENGKGHAGIRGTAWAAINAVAEFADHDKQTRLTGGRGEIEARGMSLLFGAAARMKQKAVDEVYALLKAA
jgi:phage/plasmid-like protein (TIGR03299 family)